MNVFLRILQRIYFVYAFSVFLIVMLLIFPFVVICSFFGRIRGGNLVYRLTNLWGDICFFMLVMRVKKIYESPHDKNKAYIFVANHNSYADAGFVVKVIRQPLRILGKAEMMKIPVFGLIYKSVVVPVYRSSVENRAQSIRIIKSLVSKKISVFIFPEGTFNLSGNPLKEFFNGAFRIAIETQTPIKPVIFLDTYARIPGSLFNLNPGRCRAVFLNEIPVTGLTIDDLPDLKQKVFRVMHDKLIEYDGSWMKKEMKTER